MAIENFTTGWTETDPNGRLSQTSTRTTWTGLTNNEDANLQRSSAVSFTGDFDISFDFYINSSSGNEYQMDGIIALRNVGDTSAAAIQAGDQDGSKVGITIYTIELSGFTIDESGNTNTLNVNTTYYARWRRDDDGGTGDGRVTLDVFTSDALRIADGTPSLALAYNVTVIGKEDYTIVRAPGVYNGEYGLTCTGYLENLDLAYVPPATGGFMTTNRGFWGA